MSDADAAALCSLVVVSGTWGLEAFYTVKEPKSGLSLGDLVRTELPSYLEHKARAQELVELYKPGEP